ncbi:hypothetical protein ABK040_013953 [Willaertia magna]
MTLTLDKNFVFEIPEYAKELIITIYIGEEIEKQEYSFAKRDHGTTNLLKVTNFKFTFDKLERIKGEDLPKDALHLLDENCPEEENLKKRKEREDNDENLYPKQKVSSPTLIFNTLLDEVSVLLNNSHCLNSPLQTENEFNQLFINEPQNEVTTHNVHTNTDNNPFCWATTHNVQRSNVLGENLNDEIHSLFISDNTFL